MAGWHHQPGTYMYFGTCMYNTLSWAECQNAFRTHPNEDGCGIHGTSGSPTGLRYVAFWQKMSWNANRGTATWCHHFSTRPPPRTNPDARPFQAYQRAFLRTLICLRALNKSGVMEVS